MTNKKNGYVVVWYEYLLYKKCRVLAKNIREHIDSFIDFLQAVIEIHHVLTVEVYDAPFVSVGHYDTNVQKDYFGYRTLGVFMPFFQKRKLRPVIRIASQLIGYRHFMGARSDAEALRMLLETIAHEFVHYEQIRDRRPINEVGVDARAKALVEEYLGLRKKHVRTKPLKKAS